MADIDKLTKECEQLRLTVMKEWRGIGGCVEMLSSRFLRWVLEEQAKINGDYELFCQYRDRIYNSREVRTPEWLPVSLHKYWDWRPILHDVQWVYRHQTPLEPHMLARIYYHIGGRWDGNEYTGVVTSPEMEEIFTLLTADGDRDDNPYFSVAKFLCSMYDYIGDVPNAILCSAIWTINAYLALKRSPPFVLLCDSVPLFQVAIQKEVEGETQQMRYRRVEKFLLEQIHDSMHKYKVIMA